MVRRVTGRRPKPRRQGPSLRIHANGQYTVRINRKDYYLGTDLETAQRERFRLLDAAAAGELPTRQPRPAAAPHDAATMTVDELSRRYLDDVRIRKPEYIRGGRLIGHGADIEGHLRLLRSKFGELSANMFGKGHLAKLRGLLVEQRLARNTINRRLARIRELFRWGAEQELVSDDVYPRLLIAQPDGDGGLRVFSRNHVVDKIARDEAGNPRRVDVRYVDRWLDYHRLMFWDQDLGQAFLWDVDLDEDEMIPIEGIEEPGQFVFSKDGKTIFIFRTTTSSDIWILDMST